MATAERLRDEIDRGRTGDKVPFPDPAAAPLGPDDEAAGFAPEVERIEAARAAERGGDPRRAPAVTHEDARGYNGEANDRVPRATRSGRGSDRRAVFMLAGAVLVMGAALSLWAALMS